MLLSLTIYLLLFFAIQFLVGNINTDLLAFPLGEALGLALYASLWVLHREKKDSRWVRQLRSPRLACWLLTLIAGFCIVGGTLPSLSHFPTTWPFVALLVALSVNLFLAILHRLDRFSLKKDGAFITVHTGLWLALASGMIGAGETRELNVMVHRNDVSAVGIDRSGRPEPLGYTLKMERFSIEKNPADGSPVQYRADVLLNNRHISVSVNHPYQMNPGEDIYLTHFDMAQPYGEINYCILTVVRQPWKYPMLAGIVMLLIGVLWYMELLNRKQGSDKPHGSHPAVTGKEGGR